MVYHFRGKGTFGKHHKALNHTALSHQVTSTQQRYEDVKEILAVAFQSDVMSPMHWSLDNRAGKPLLFSKERFGTFCILTYLGWKFIIDIRMSRKPFKVGGFK